MVSEPVEELVSASFTGDPALRQAQGPVWDDYPQVWDDGITQKSRTTFIIPSHRRNYSRELLPVIQPVQYSGVRENCS